MHSSALAWITGFKSSRLLLMVQESVLTRLLWSVRAFDQNPTLSLSNLSHQNHCQVAVLLKKFALYRISSIRLQKDFLRKNSQLAVVTVPNSMEPSWSLLLVELASRVLRRRGPAPLLPSQILFQRIAWLLSAEPPTSLAEIPLLPRFF